MKIRLMFVVGTRPEVIKMAPLILAARQDSRFEVIVCSTGQHREMIQPLFHLFKIVPNYDFNLMRPGQTLHDITIGVLDQMRVCVHKDKPDWILVQGDTTSAMAASLCGFYDKVAVAHVEAGLRTSNMHSPFPEELNRRVTALVARLHFPPTKDSEQNLLREGISAAASLVTGNTGIDALLKVNDLISSDPKLNQDLHQEFSFLDESKKLILATIHRRESFGAPMESILKAFLSLAKRGDVELILPLHLNPQVRIAAEKILEGQARWISSDSKKGDTAIWLAPPLDYLKFIYAMKRSYFIVSDSGGVQEEAPSLGKPVLVVRETTERPEAVAAGTSKLIGSAQDRVQLESELLLDHEDEYIKMARAHNPYGDGQAAKRILDKIAITSSDIGSPL